MLSVDDIISLLSLCLKATYFSFRGVIYQQVYGTAMGFDCGRQPGHGIHRGKGSFYIFISTCFWKRYVDVCTAVNQNKILVFLEHLNSIHPSIQYTHEIEKSNKCLPFLDVLLERNGDGSLSTSVYQKPSHTDR